MLNHACKTFRPAEQEILKAKPMKLEYLLASKILWL